MIRLFVFYLFSLNVSSIHAQDSLTLSVDEFLSIVKAYHPVMKQYQNTMAIAKANVNSARGGFDPNLDAKTGRKNIDGIHYYDQQEVNLQIPTWFGIDFNAGYDRIEGQKINTSQTKGELLHIGLTVPLA
ncbi:MAG: TolC family protein, partial [Chitinophagales bacterium]|nr:TolC family protein [Chitinophagales bacterium]